MNSEQICHQIQIVLDDNKALEVSQLDVRTLTDITDYLLICTATSHRHALALADKVERCAKELGERPLCVEGDAQSDWILVDLGSLIIHIMLQTARDTYDLETLWALSKELRNKTHAD